MVTGQNDHCQISGGTTNVPSIKPTYQNVNDDITDENEEQSPWFLTIDVSLENGTEDGGVQKPGRDSGHKWHIVAQ